MDAKGENSLIGCLEDGVRNFGSPLKSNSTPSNSFLSFTLRRLLEKRKYDLRKHMSQTVQSSKDRTRGTTGQREECETLC